MTVLVPTMGALHKGHQALIKRARTLDKDVIVSIFVNPLQFENKSDLETYPRSPERDIEIATIAGANEVWFPEYEDLYPEGFKTLSAGSLSNVYEGASRPGHFDGVATVVVKLLNAVMPDAAYFGRKDFQQLAVIRSVVRDLNIRCEVRGVPTVRNEMGLALSSRNSRLSPYRLKQASIIYSILIEMANMARNSETSSLTLQNHFKNGIQSISAVKVEYVDVVDSDSLVPVAIAQKGTTICVAVWFDDVRLIDNISI